MDSNENMDVSRRGFIKGGAFIALGTVAASASLGSLIGCTSDSNESTVQSEDGSLSVSGVEVYETDVLVIGGGVGGAQVALKALAEGVAVMLVDKGPFQFSGAGGMNFDIMIRHVPEGTPPQADAGGATTLANQALREKAWPFSIWDVPTRYIQNGVSTFRRNPDGTVYTRIPPEAPDNAIFSTDFGFMRHATDVVLDKGITVYDETMITDFIVQDGICRGAIGLHIPTGAFRVFRAKATVKATGGCTAFNGWVSVNACTTQGGDNTADADVAAYRQGCELIACEFFRWDTVSSRPDGVAFAFNSGFTADTVNADDITDVDGTNFLEGVTDRTVFFQTAAKQAAASKANENGAFYVEYTPEKVEMMRPVYKRNIELWKKMFDIDVEGAKVEVTLQPYEHGGSPRIDENMMSLSIEGLFDARGSDAYGESAGLTSVSAFRFGPYAGYCASEYVKTLGLSDEAPLDWSLVNAEVERLNEIRTQEVARGLKPFEVRHAIQETCRAGISPAGNAEQYETAITELKRIIDEDIPKQVVSNKTLLFNTEWKQAIENQNLATIGMATVKAMLAREETRGQFLRVDFPEPDDEYWGKHNVAIRLENNDMVAEAIPVD